MELREIAKMVREKKGLTQKEFAYQMGWGHSTYQAFEQNKILHAKYPNPTKDKLESLAIACGGHLTITLTR